MTAELLKWAFEIPEINFKINEVQTGAKDIFLWTFIIFPY